MVPFQRMTEINLATLDRRVEKGPSTKVIFRQIPDFK